VGSVNDSGTYTFADDLDPTISSATNTGGTANSTFSLPTITITALDVSGYIDTTNGIRIRIPGGLDAVFDGSILNPTFGGAASGKVDAAVTYEDLDATLVITVDTQFVNGDVLTVSGLALEAGASSSSG